MKTEDLEVITNSIKEKLGDEGTALIADDLALLFSENSKTYTDIQNKSKEITNLKNDKEKLIQTNGNLLLQIPMGIEKENEDSKKEDSKPFNFNDVFDERGRFKRKM